MTTRLLILALGICLTANFLSEKEATPILSERVFTPPSPPAILPTPEAAAGGGIVSAVSIETTAIDEEPSTEDPSQAAARLVAQARGSVDAGRIEEAALRFRMARTLSPNLAAAWEGEIDALDRLRRFERKVLVISEWERQRRVFEELRVSVIF